MNKILFLMVTSVNKWLSIPAFILFAGLIGYYEPGLVERSIAPVAKNVHPFHISTTEINHNAKDKTLEISCRIFIDDFESCLSKQYHTKADLSAATMKTAMDTLIKKYLSSHLQIKTDGKTTGMEYLGFEKEGDVVYAYFESSNIVSVKTIEVNNSILHDMYDDQTNIIHVIIGGNRKSAKLDYPNKQAVFNF